MRGEEGVQGGNAGRGGNGGGGGEQGTIRINGQQMQQNNNYRVTINAQNGAIGPRGDYGNRGRGGKHGNGYGRVYIAEYVAPGIRGIDNKSCVLPRSISAQTLLDPEKTMNGMRIIASASKNIGHHAYQQLGKKALTEVGKQAFKEGTKVVAKNAAAATYSFGTTLGAQFVVSVVSAYVSSGWEGNGYEIIDNTRAPDGGLNP